VAQAQTAKTTSINRMSRQTKAKQQNRLYIWPMVLDAIIAL